MSEVVPLSEQSSEELKTGLRAVDGSIARSRQVHSVEEWFYHEIMDDLEKLSYELKVELAGRWTPCQDHP